MKRTLWIVGLGLIAACGGGEEDAPEEPDAAVSIAVPDAAAAPVVDAGLAAQIDYRVTGVVGSFSGDGTNVVSPTQTDTLARNTCTYDSPGTLASQSQLIAATGSTRMVGVAGTTSCPAGMATSTTAAPCTSQPINAVATVFQWNVDVDGWADDSVVTFRVNAPPSGLPGCNYASVIIDAAKPWGIEGTTTVGAFRAGTAFPVRFVGSKALTAGSKSSNVSWDFTMTVMPLPTQM